MEIKKLFRCSTAHVGLCKGDKWCLLITSYCTRIGQRKLCFDSYHDAIREYNFLLTLTNGIEHE